MLALRMMLSFDCLLTSYEHYPRNLTAGAPAAAAPPPQDGYFEKDRVAKGDPGKREFTYFMLGASRFLYASSARLILLKVRSIMHIIANEATAAVWSGRPLSF